MRAGRAIRMMMAGLWLMATLVVALAPAAAHVAGSSPPGATAVAHDDCPGMGDATDDAALRPSQNAPCGDHTDLWHGVACVVGGACVNLPAIAPTTEPAPMIGVSVEPPPVASRLRSGIDRAPDLRPPRLSVRTLSIAA